MKKNVQQTSKESYIEVLKNLGERQLSCLQALEAIGEGTANDVARYLHMTGQTPYFDRNFAHPRLNELVSKELVVITGKKIDELTRRRSIVYKVKEA